jgi:lysylphosphatidylglycerol synthetase-like protein (DUF2156 family)
MRFPLGPAALLALLGTFLLPFIDFSCKGKKIEDASLTGYQVAFGKERVANLDLGRLFGQEGDDPAINLRFEHNNRTEGKPLVAAALIVGVLGGLVGFLKRPAGALGGVAAVVLLLIAQTQIQREVQEQAPMIVITFQWGFWASLGCAAAGGVLCLLGGRK